MQAKSILQSKKKRLYRAVLIGFLLALITFALYWPVQSFDFVYDDHLYVTDNRQVQDGFTLDGLKWSFTTFHAGNWHPLAWLSHMADFEVYGSYAGGHHWTSVLIHTASALLLFFVMSSITGALWGSAFVAAARGGVEHGEARSRRGTHAARLGTRARQSLHRDHAVADRREQHLATRSVPPAGAPPASLGAEPRAQTAREREARELHRLRRPGPRRGHAATSAPRP